MAEFHELGTSIGAASLSTIKPPSGMAIEPQRPFVSVLRPERRFLEPGRNQILRSGREKGLADPSSPYRREHVAGIDFPNRWFGVLVRRRANACEPDHLARALRNKHVRAGARVPTSRC